MSQTSDSVSVDIQTESASTAEKAKGREAKNRITFFSQIIVIYAVIATAIFHLSFQSPDKELWLVLLSSSLGYILPTPGLKFVKPPKPLGS